MHVSPMGRPSASWDSTPCLPSRRAAPRHGTGVCRESCPRRDLEDGEAVRRIAEVVDGRVLWGFHVGAGVAFAGVVGGDDGCRLVGATSSRLTGRVARSQSEHRLWLGHGRCGPSRHSPYGETRYSWPTIRSGSSGTWRGSPLVRPVVVSISVCPIPSLANPLVRRLIMRVHAVTSYCLAIAGNVVRTCVTARRGPGRHDREAAVGGQPPAVVSELTVDRRSVVAAAIGRAGDAKNENPRQAQSQHQSLHRCSFRFGEEAHQRPLIKCWPKGCGRFSPDQDRPGSPVTWTGGS